MKHCDHHSSEVSHSSQSYFIEANNNFQNQGARAKAKVAERVWQVQGGWSSWDGSHSNSNDNGAIIIVNPTHRPDISQTTRNSTNIPINVFTSAIIAFACPILRISIIGLARASLIRNTPWNPTIAALGLVCSTFHSNPRSELGLLHLLVPPHP